jgi:DNA polymerase III subunit gamma/tau
MALVRISRMEDLESLDSLVERLSVLEAGGTPARRPEPGVAKKGGTGAEMAGTAPVRVPTRVHEGAPIAKDVKASEPDGSGPRQRVLPPGQGHDLAPQPRLGSEAGTVGVEARAEPSRQTQSDSSSERESAPLELETIRRIWPEVLAKMKSRWRLQLVDPSEVIVPNIVVIAPKPGYHDSDGTVGSPETLKLLAKAFQAVMNRTVEVRFQPSSPRDDSAQDGRDLEPRRVEALTSDPLVQKVVELFEARPVQMDYDGPDAGASA